MDKNKNMNRIAYCQACNMIRHGVKTRIALEHTCGLERGAIPEDMVKPMQSYPPVVHVKNPYIDEIIKNAHTVKEVFVISTKHVYHMSIFDSSTERTLYLGDDGDMGRFVTNARHFGTYDLALDELKKVAEPNYFYQVEKHYVKK